MRVLVMCAFMCFSPSIVNSSDYVRSSPWAGSHTAHVIVTTHPVCTIFPWACKN